MTLSSALLKPPPLSLYIHIPWCVQKCPYCDFNSHTLKHHIDETAYLNALIADLTQELPHIWGRRLVSIFIGGGTPSLMSGDFYDRLFSQIRALIPFAPDIEITLEANPNSVEADKFQNFFDAGIHRISIGVQSFQQHQLQQLGRAHSVDEAHKAIHIAQSAGFERINVDLMYGLPKQSLQECQQDLQKAIDSGVTHISWYQLTLEPNTPFYRQPPVLPNDDTIADMMQTGLEYLQEQGFTRYEISAFSSNKVHACQHNINYWQFGDYLGIGAGAHGKRTMINDNNIVRTMKHKHPKAYLQNHTHDFIQTQETIPLEDLPLEFMMNALRLTQGVPAHFFEERTGLSISTIMPLLRHLKNKTYLSDSLSQIQATDTGLQFLNDLLEHFLPDNFKQNQSSIDIQYIT